MHCNICHPVTVMYCCNSHMVTHIIPYTSHTTDIVSLPAVSVWFCDQNLYFTRLARCVSHIFSHNISFLCPYEKHHLDQNYNHMTPALKLMYFLILCKWLHREAFAVPGYYTACFSSCLPFWDSLLVPTSGVKQTATQRRFSYFHSIQLKMSNRLHSP